MARKIDQTLKIHKLERKCSQNGDTYINFFQTDDDEDSFHVQRYWGKVKSFIAMLKQVKVMANVRNARKVPMRVKSGYVPLYVNNGTGNLSNFI